MNCSLCGHELPVALKSWAFVLPLEPPSQNKVAQNKGPGRFAYAKVRRDYEFLLAGKRAVLGIPEATGKRRVHVVRLYSGHGKVRDLGNIVGGCKPLIDAMTNVGLICDDAVEFIEAHYSQRRGSASGVSIQLDELDGGTGG